MTILCITGFSNASTQLAERALLACGMAPHLPLERDPTLDLVRWHERVSSTLPLRGQPTHSESAARTQQPSRIWQQLAIDLILANMDSAHWGWAHPGAVKWLEFWAQLDSDIRFVLVCEDRQSLICRLVEQGEAPANMPGHLALWAQNHQDMLKFHLRNPDRSLLVWDAEVQSQPSTLIQRIERDWQIPLDAALAHAQDLVHPTALLRHIALRILSEHPQTAPIDHELQSLIGPSQWPAASDQIETTDLIEMYGHLLERTDLQGQLQRAQQSSDDINELRSQDFEKAKAEIAAKQDALSKLAAEQKASAALKKQKDDLSAAQQEALAKNKELQDESDLLLTQLHQVQEELEKHFLMNQEAQEKVKVETAAKQDALNKLATEQKASKALKTQKDELSAAQQVTLAKNKDLQAALDKQVLLTKETQEKVKVETAAKQDALNKLATEQKASAAFKKQKDDLSAAQQEALAKNKELQEESDLLLAQLHQVQEELEKYYLQHKERQIEVQKLQDRWLRAVQSHPELQDFEVLELLSESSTELTAHWRINQLQVGDVMKGPFEFKTFIENGVTGLVFAKEAKGQSLIHRWPLIAAKESQLSIIPVKGKDDPQKRSATLLQLGTTDWHLVRQLSDKLVKTVGSAAMAKRISHGPALLEGLKTQQQILDKVPALLRFDDIQLFGQQNTDQKSVIGLRLTHADLQGLKANPFEFQVQLNHAANSAMTSAHLIFDEKTAGNPFENWTHNVKSSAGQAVMAVQLGPKGWNPQTWHALSPLDQQWLQNTARLLPFMLTTLQNQGVKLAKGWTTWVQAATQMMDWSKLSVDLAQATNSIKEAAPSQLQPPEAAPISPKKALRQASQAKAKPSQTTKATKISKLQPLAASPSATKAPTKTKPAKTLKPELTKKPAVRPKSSVTKKPAVTPKPAVTAKTATKTVRSSGARTAVVPKAKRRSP